jgi:hypothetical protein
MEIVKKPHVLGLILNIYSFVLSVICTFHALWTLIFLIPLQILIWYILFSPTSYIERVKTIKIF